MAVVYVLQEEGSNYFRIGRSPERLEAEHFEHRGDRRPLVLFREIHTEDSDECEGMFHRLLGGRRVQVGGHTDFFEVETDVMAEQVARISKIFSQLQTARDRVRPLTVADVTCAEREAEGKDVELRRRLLELKRERTAIDLQIELLELKSKERIGDSSGIAGIASWKLQARRCFDERTFRERRPELYEQTLERFYCLDTARWKKADPEGYRAVQTTCYRMSSGRAFRLLP